MAVKVAINGFGRIGRLVLRGMIETGRTDLIPVAINGAADIETNVHLFRYDSVHGRFPGTVTVDGNTITITHNGLSWGPIRMMSDRDPAKLDFKDVDVVLECTGSFTKKDKAMPLIEAAGARKVVISAPGDGVDATIVVGVNDADLKPEMQVISSASCTTNCLAPMAKVLHDSFGIQRGYMVTIHAYTGDQRLVDAHHRDMRRARAAAGSLIPTSTGAAKAVGLVLPALKGKLDGTSIRIPIQNVSMVTLDVDLARAVTVDEVNAAMRAASVGPMQGVLDYNTEKLVSIDFNHSPASCTFDATQTAVVDGTFARVLGWYDNEWGFSLRMLDLAARIGAH